jgi:signal transduction histidine kinase
MRAGLSEVLGLGVLNWISLVAMLCLPITLWMLWLQARMRLRERRRDNRMRQELEAYAQLDVRLPPNGDISGLARRVCRVVRQKSLFSRPAMLVRDPEGRLYVAGSAGMDRTTVASLNTWAERLLAAERAGGPGAHRGDGGLGVGAGDRSFAVVLGESPTGNGCARAIVFPLWTTSGRMAGLLAVCADGLLNVRRRSIREAVQPLEALAVKLARTMENAALAERLQRAEKLASLGLLAGGVAHALNNPLTAVLGFAELIANTSDEARVKADADIIAREARRMRETVESLLNFWKPASLADEPVDLVELLRELETACAETLQGRGVRLVVQAGDAVPAVRGNRARLRQVLEHLLNNAAQAIGAVQAEGARSSQPAVDGVQHEIRLALSHDPRRVHLLVSDTGPGFREPGQVFDPLYTAQQTGSGAGLGLSLCHGIVREHGGEISVFNLQPHGAAVVVELPPMEAIVEKTGGVLQERACVAGD